MWARVVLVTCPSCSGCAVVRRHPNVPESRRYGREIMFDHRVTCTACTFVKDWSMPRVPGAWRSSDFADGKAVDPWFHLPVFLSVRLPEGTIWAYNRAHLERIKAYVAASLRERRPERRCVAQSMVEVLPAWMKAAHNRARVLAAIRHLEARLRAVRATAPTLTL